MTINDKRLQTYVSPDLYASIEVYASHHGISVSKAASDLIVQGLAGFTFGHGSTQLLHSVDRSLHPVDTSDFITRAEFESRMNSLLVALGQYKGEFEFAQNFITGATKFVEEQSKKELMAKKGLTSKQAQEVIDQAKYEADELLIAQDSDTEHLDQNVHPQVLLARAKAKARASKLKNLP